MLSNLYDKIRIEEVRSFMSSEGKICNMQLIFCPKSNDFKKSAVVEFENMECVLLALGMNGTKLKGQAAVIQPIMKKEELNILDKYLKMSVKIENLAKETTLGKIENLFKPFGCFQSKICDEERNEIEIIFDRFNNALAAIRELHDALVDDHRIIVKLM